MTPTEPARDQRAEVPADPEFAASVAEGLARPIKRLSSRWFYDAEGDRLFQRIMASPEYYLTDAELEIMREQGDDIARALAGDAEVELLELGAGDGQKIQCLIDAFHRLDIPLVFRPLDISANVLEILRERIAPSRPWLDLQPIHGDYHDVLPALEPTDRRRVVAFLGSNLGNFEGDTASEFLTLVRSSMKDTDRLLIGLDLQKEPAVIRAAYNDAGGATRAFNLNLLTRINRELGGDFDITAFEHRPSYDPDSGRAESRLVSLRDQRVTLEAIGRGFDFAAGEEIFMEVSQKYDRAMIEALARDSGYAVAHAFTDQREWFTDQVWRPI